MSDIGGKKTFGNGSMGSIFVGQGLCKKKNPPEMKCNDFAWRELNERKGFESFMRQGVLCS